MISFSLDGDWELFGLQEKQGESLTFAEAAACASIRIAGSVPGNVECDLVRAGIEQDPFYADHVYRYRKYECYQWWLKRIFVSPKETGSGRAFLRFCGLDTIAAVFLNGKCIGQAANMLIDHEFDVTDDLKAGAENELVVRLSSAVNEARNKDYPVMVGGGDPNESLWLRKPPHCFGWDIMPRLPSCGITRGVTLELRPDTRFTELYFATMDIDRGRNIAHLMMKYRFTADAVMTDDFALRVSGTCGTHAFEWKDRVLFVSGEARIAVSDPALWWPAGYGDPCLYTVTAELLHNGVVADTRTERIGIRTACVELRMAAGDDGEFLIRVNDCPILAKGANWVPLDALHSRDAARLQKAHDLLKDTGSNIARCWGGNVYEDHAFFDLCDERGILVWQDFSLACSLYPQTPDFLAAMEEEATSVIKKLRNHTSILLWAGDNEVDEKYSDLGFATEENRYNALTRECLPRAVRMHDPYRRFLPSSPYIADGVARYDVPEQHNWGERAYFKDPFYRDSKAHFISECGYFGCPCKESLLRYIPETELWPFEGSASWYAHSTDYSPDGPRPNSRTHLMLEQARLFFGRYPDTIEEFIQMSQVSQAEAKKFFIERTRVKKWRRTGIIWWNLLDGWPQASEALVDYYFQKKRVFSYVQRVQTPVCIMFDELSQWNYRVVIGNDSRKDCSVSYEIVCYDTDEIVLKGERLSPANENLVVGDIRVNPTVQCLYLIRYTVDGRRFGNHYIAGFPPYELEKMKKWLREIDALPFNEPGGFAGVQQEGV